MGLLAVRGFAQTPSGIGLLKVDEYSQQSATAEQAAQSVISVFVSFASTPPESTTVRLKGPGMSLNLQRQPDGTYEVEQPFSSRAALDSAFPDGIYSLSVSGGSASSTTSFMAAFGSAVAPVLITNYSFLQPSPSAYPSFQWQQIPGAAYADELDVDISDAAGDDLASGAYAGYATSASNLGPVPQQVPLTCDLTYGRLAYQEANGAATNVGTGSGFDVEFTFSYVLSPPVIIGQPVSAVIQNGANPYGAIGVGVSYEQAAPYSYQWYKNGSPIPGATNPKLGLSDIQPSDQGSYTVQVSNAAGSVVSNPATVAVAPRLPLSVYAGPSGSQNSGGAAISTTFGYPCSLAVDSLGNLYVADLTNLTIIKITPGGIVSTIAGQSGQSGTADGLGGAARFVGPTAIAVDTAGNLYVVDGTYILSGVSTGAASIRKIDTTGMVTTLAGGAAGSQDGAGSAAQFYQPNGVAVDAAGNVYIADTGNNKIRKMTPGGVVTTLAGSGIVGTVDGVGSAAQFSFPLAVACDKAGDVYVAGHSGMRKITPTGVVTTLVGGEFDINEVDGLLGSATMAWPSALAFDAAGDLFVIDSFFMTIRELTPQGVVTTVYQGSTGIHTGLQVGALAIGPDGTCYVTSSTEILSGKLLPGGTDPEIFVTSQPQAAAIIPGGSAAFSVLATGPALTYQWMKNGIPIAGATSAQYVMTSTSSADLAAYSVEVGDGAGAVFSNPAVLTETSTTDPGRLINLSTLAVAGSGSQTLDRGLFHRRCGHHGIAASADSRPWTDFVHDERSEHHARSPVESLLRPDRHRLKLRLGHALEQPSSR